MTICELGNNGIIELQHTPTVGAPAWLDALTSFASSAAKSAIPGKAAPLPAGADPILTYTYDQANKVLAALAAVGIQQPALSYAVYQTYHETQAYTNNGVKSYNNYSGIKYAGQKGATKGPNGYAVFKSMSDWANAFKHEITKGANPAGAKTLEDYAARLKTNGYYEDTTANYIAGNGQTWYRDIEGAYNNSVAGLKRARLVLKELPAADRASVQDDGSVQAPQDMDIPGTKDLSKPQNKIVAWWQSLTGLQQVGVGTGAGLLLLLAVRK